MRQLLLVILLCSLAPQLAHAQPIELALPAPAEPSAAERLALYHAEVARVRSARSLVAAGAAMTGIGLALSGIGGLLFAVAPLVQMDHPGPARDQQQGSLRNAGAALIGVGAASFVTGVPILAVGATRTRNAQRRLLSLSLSGLQGQF